MSSIEKGVDAIRPSYAAIALPFNARKLATNLNLAISESGDHVVLDDAEMLELKNRPASLSLERQAELRSKFFLGQGSHAGMQRLLKSRKMARRETVDAGPSLHIIVPTLQCAHSCQYCQVSRSLADTSHSLLPEQLDAACDTIFQSKAQALTVEFQGGDPLIRFDLVKRAVLRIQARNLDEGRTIRIVVASTLHQLTEEMCRFFKEHDVYLSISVDGPQALHNRNRPTPGRNAYEKTMEGVALAHRLMGRHTVSALMTTTRASLPHADGIVDEYVKLGFNDIFLRPLSSYGFAKRNHAMLGYSVEEFQAFYLKALARILEWNRQGVVLREAYASIILNKMLSTFDAGYVDLQSPTGAGQSVLVYNYDGYVYPSDEARMLKETGDTSLRLGQIGDPLNILLGAAVRQDLIRASTREDVPACRQCAYNNFCAPNPVDAQAQFGSMFANVEETEHCRRHMWLFDTFFRLLHEADDWTLDLFHAWAKPARSGRNECAV